MRKSERIKWDFKTGVAVNINDKIYLVPTTIFSYLSKARLEYKQTHGQYIQQKTQKSVNEYSTYCSQKPGGIFGEYDATTTLLYSILGYSAEETVMEIKKLDLKFCYENISKKTSALDTYMGRLDSYNINHPIKVLNDCFSEYALQFYPEYDSKEHILVNIDSLIEGLLSDIKESLIKLVNWDLQPTKIFKPKELQIKTIVDPKFTIEDKKLYNKETSWNMELNVPGFACYFSEGFIKDNQRYKYIYPKGLCHIFKDEIFNIIYRDKECDFNKIRNELYTLYKDKDNEKGRTVCNPHFTKSCVQSYLKRYFLYLYVNKELTNFVQPYIEKCTQNENAEENSTEIDLIQEPLEIQIEQCLDEQKPTIVKFIKNLLLKLVNKT